MKLLSRKSPWAWVPSLYFAEGLPYIVVNVIAVILYKNLGMSNTDIAFYTGWLYLPWVIKPFWSPFVDIVKTKRWWTVAMQFVMGFGFAAVAFTIPMDSHIQLTLAVFWLIGFASATHDIAADGFYMHALDSSNQSLFVGIRSTFYRGAVIFGQGALVMIAGFLETTLDSVPKAWTITFVFLSVFFLLITIYHHFMLPMPNSDSAAVGKGEKTNLINEFFGTFGSFFRKKHVLVTILFVLLYRLPEAQLVKLINPFLLDARDVGGLGLSTSEVGFVYGTIGIIGLTIGGVLGGIMISRDGLRKWLWPMALSLTLPCVVFCYLSIAQPNSDLLINMVIINAAVFIEQLGYGFGFTAFLLYMMSFAQGKHKTSHYAICTAFMALGMMLPGMAAGWIQEQLGYVNFFWWIMICCIATFIVTALIKIDPNYGKKSK